MTGGSDGGHFARRRRANDRPSLAPEAASPIDLVPGPLARLGQHMVRPDQRREPALDSDARRRAVELGHPGYSGCSTPATTTLEPSTSTPTTSPTPAVPNPTPSTSTPVAATKGGVQLDPALPEYVPVQGVTGKINSVGSDTMNNEMTLWAEGLRKHYPSVQVEIEGKGSSTAPPALIESASQFGPMSRDMKGKEIDLLDGIKIIEEHGWAQVVPDANEPLVHVYAEGDTEEEAHRLEEGLRRLVEEIISGAAQRAS